MLLKMTPEAFPNYVSFETGDKVLLDVDNGKVVFLGEINGIFVGTVRCNVDHADVSKGQIGKLAVLPEYRRNMFGELLMKHAEVYLKQCNVSKIKISMVAHFSKLQRYYEQMGYMVKDTRSIHSLPFNVMFLEKSL